MMGFFDVLRFLIGWRSSVPGVIAVPAGPIVYTTQDISYIQYDVLDVIYYQTDTGDFPYVQHDFTDVP